jgi:chloride channel 3/4/5
MEAHQSGLQGVYGAYFSKLNYRWSRDVRGGTWLKAHPIAEVILVSIRARPVIRLA